MPEQCVINKYGQDYLQAESLHRTPNLSAFVRTLLLPSFNMANLALLFECDHVYIVQPAAAQGITCLKALISFI